MSHGNNTVLTAGAASDEPFVMTPYAAVELVNRALKNAGVLNPRTGQPKTVRPPMIYIYAAKQKFTCTRAADGRWDIDRPSFDKWVADYVGRALERQRLKKALAG